MKVQFVLFAVIAAVSFCQAECLYRVEGDLNNDCQTDLVDFSLMGSRWLTDCHEFPLDPACRCDIPWVPEPSMNEARDSFAGGVIDGKIYVFGGNGNPDGGDLNSTEVYDPATHQWSRLADNPHVSGSGSEELHCAVVHDKLYVFGSYDQGMSEMYDPMTNTWETLAPKPTPIHGSPTVYNHEIYIFGGGLPIDQPDPNDHRKIECYNPDSNTWRFVTNMPELIVEYGIATIGTKAYLFGGFDWSDPLNPQFHNKVITYDFETNTWETVSEVSAPKGMVYGYAIAAPVIDGKVYLVGRTEVDVFKEELVLGTKVDIYDPVANTWEQGTPMPVPLHNHMKLAIGKKIYVLGGCSTPFDWGYKNRSKDEVISYDTEFCSQ